MRRSCTEIRDMVSGSSRSYRCYINNNGANCTFHCLSLLSKILHSRFLLCAAIVVIKLYPLIYFLYSILVYFPPPWNLLNMEFILPKVDVFAITTMGHLRTMLWFRLL